MLRFAQRIQWNLVFIAGLYLSGLFLWGLFFNWGDIPYQYYDWAEVNMPRLTAVKDAVDKNTLPLHLKVSNVLRCGKTCDRYFSAIDGLASPDLIFLKWMPVGRWLVLHFWLLYTAGFAGMLALRRRFNLSLPLFGMAYLLFNFNGHILAHLSVGHITWGGYFLFPWLVVLVDQFIQGDNSWGWVLKVAVLLFTIFLQGSFHQFVWSLIFLGFLSLAYFRRFFTVFKALVFSCLVSAFRLIPPAMAFGSFNREFLGGYPDLVTLYITLSHWVSPTEAQPYQHLDSNLGYWEFNLFIGKVGLAFLLLAGLAWVIQQILSRKAAWVLLPIAGLFLLSYDGVYEQFSRLPIPLLYGERVSTRIISLAFVLFLFLSIAAVQKLADQLGRWKWIFEVAMFLVAIYQAVVIIPAVPAWGVLQASRAFPFTAAEMSGYLINNHPDPVYFLALGGGALTSVLTIALLAWLTRREGKKAGSPQLRSARNLSSS